MIDEYLIKMGWKKYNGKWDKAEVIYDFTFLTIVVVIVAAGVFIKGLL